MNILFYLRYVFKLQLKKYGHIYQVGPRSKASTWISKTEVKTVPDAGLSSDIIESNFEFHCLPCLFEIENNT